MFRRFFGQKILAILVFSVRSTFRLPWWFTSGYIGLPPPSRFHLVGHQTMSILDAGLVLPKLTHWYCWNLNDGILRVEDANFVFVHICNVMCQSPQPLICFSFKNRHFLSELLSFFNITKFKFFNFIEKACESDSWVWELLKSKSNLLRSVRHWQYWKKHS